MKKVKYISTILIAGLIIFFWYQVNKTPLQHNLDVISLNLGEVDLPVNITCSEETYNLQWNYSEPINQQLYLDTYLPGTNTNNAKVFIWEGEINIVYLAIANFNYPLVARINYLLLNPARLFEGDYDNFLTKKNSIIPEDWKLNSTEADNTQVQCGAGNKDKCYGWFYQARFSQYVLLIADPGPYCSEGFASVVQPIIEQFSTIVKK